MFYDGNGGGLTREVVEHLADVLGEAYLVSAGLDEEDEITSVSVAGPSTRGAVRLEPRGFGVRTPDLGSAEWWRGGYDPNGAPSAWCDYDPASSDGAEELAHLIRSGRDGRH